MKKWLAYAVLGLGSAVLAAGGAGLYGGYPEVFGIQFVTVEGWRMSVGLLPGETAGESPSVALSLDLVLAGGEIFSDGASGMGSSYYAGAGGTASLLRHNPEVNGHAMLGLQLYNSQVPSLGVFAELQLGQRFTFAPLGTNPYLGFRAGISLR